MANTAARILVVDDHSVVRYGLRWLVESEPDLAVCGEAGHAAQVLPRVAKQSPDLVLLDLSLQGVNGLELTKQLRAHYPELPVLIVSVHDEQLYAERALRAGARGYVMKGASDEELLRAMRTVIDGKLYASDDIMAKLYPLEAGTLSEEKVSPVERLSDRELEVFRLLGQGYAPRHIAEEMYLSRGTVETHRRRIREKLHVDSAADLTRYAVQWYKDQST